MTGLTQPIRRMKTYAGGQGYVYQYYFVGKRPTRSSAVLSTEYVFDVTSDRKTMFSVSVFLPENVLADWSAAHGRALTDAEQYAAVKMRLFQAFDEVDNMMAHGRQLQLDAAGLEERLAILGVQ
jgi:hypothetical protein